MDTYLSASRTNPLVIAEQHVLDGGLACSVASVIARTYPVSMRDNKQ